MQPYKLASSSVNKQPFKIIEIPLTKFTGEVIPHHEKMFEDYKRHMNKVKLRIIFILIDNGNIIVGNYRFLQIKTKWK